jgi:hypothetical protein
MKPVPEQPIRLHSNLKEKESGFFDLPSRQLPCRDQGHAFPTHLYIPPGKGYRHICPACGQETVAYGPEVIFNVDSIKTT